MFESAGVWCVKLPLVFFPTDINIVIVTCGGKSKAFDQEKAECGGSSAAQQLIFMPPSFKVMLKLVVTVVAQVLLTFQVLSSWIVAFSSLNENPLLWMKTVAATSVRITPDTQLYVWWWKLCPKDAAKLFSRQKRCGFLLNGETSNLKPEWKLRAQSHRADPQGPVCLKPLPHRDPESCNKAASVFAFTWHWTSRASVFLCLCVVTDSEPAFRI